METRKATHLTSERGRGTWSGRRSWKIWSWQDSLREIRTEESNASHTWWDSARFGRNNKKIKHIKLQGTGRCGGPWPLMSLRDTSHKRRYLLILLHLLVLFNLPMNHNNVSKCQRSKIFIAVFILYNDWSRGKDNET